MKIYNVAALFLLLFLLSCSSSPEPQVESVGDELQQTQQEIRRAQAELAQSVVEKMDKDRAIQLAARHLALKQVRWGKPTGVEEDEDYFYVSYQTPKPERRLIGTRMLLVDKESQVVTPQKRR